MTTREIKLHLTFKQEARLNEWLWILTGVWNWAVRKIRADAHDSVYYSKFSFQNLLADHGTKIGVPSHTIQGQLRTAHEAWSKCFKKVGGRPRMKGLRNKLNSIPFPDPLLAPKNNHITIPGLGKVKFHKQDLPSGKIKCGRIIKRANGWYLCLFIDAQPNVVPITENGEIGIDPGFKHLLTLSNGEKIEHPRELETSANRLGQAQRGGNKKLAARIHQRTANQRKDRNHKLSRSLVSENGTIYFSKDNHRAIARKFGKSVTSSSHYQLRQMLSYKAQSCGRVYAEVDSRFSTVTCSNCGSVEGPSGLRGLKVREWQCSCGAIHDRDVNAAVNTLLSGRGSAPNVVRATSEIGTGRKARHSKEYA